MHRRRTAIVLAALVVAVAGACGEEPGRSSPGGGSPTATGDPSPSPTDPGPTDPPLPDLPDWADADARWSLPDDPRGWRTTSESGGVINVAHESTGCFTRWRNTVLNLPADNAVLPADAIQDHVDFLEHSGGQVSRFDAASAVFFPADFLDGELIDFEFDAYTYTDDAVQENHMVGAQRFTGVMLVFIVGCPADAWDDGRHLLTDYIEGVRIVERS